MLFGNDVPTHVRGVCTRGAARVHDRHDLAVVCLVDASQASTWEKSAGHTSQDAHVTRFRLHSRAQSLTFLKWGSGPSSCTCLWRSVGRLSWLPSSNSSGARLGSTRSAAPVRGGYWPRTIDCGGIQETSARSTLSVVPAEAMARPRPHSSLSRSISPVHNPVCRCATLASDCGG